MNDGQKRILKQLCDSLSKAIDYKQPEKPTYKQLEKRVYVLEQESKCLGNFVEHLCAENRRLRALIDYAKSLQDYDDNEAARFAARDGKIPEISN